VFPKELGIDLVTKEEVRCSVSYTLWTSEGKKEVEVTAKGNLTMKLGLVDIEKLNLHKVCLSTPGMCLEA
jgi:hypothetical protein